MSEQPSQILHLDMDAFFAAIEVRDNPALAGKPVIIGAPPHQRGVVSTASYEARKYGVTSAMPSRVAYKRCPHGIFLPGRMERYKQISRQVMTILYRFTPLVEPVSVDEAFLDISCSLSRQETAPHLARRIKHTVHRETGLTCSVGLAPNKFLAKLASEHQKPNGLTVMPSDPQEIERFLAPLPVESLWGVGPVTTQKLHRAGISTIADLQTRAIAEIAQLTGPSAAYHLKSVAKGKDNRPILTEHIEKSISNESTFLEDCTDSGVLHQTLIGLVEKVGRRLRKSNKIARTGHIKIRYEDFHTITRQESLRPPTASDRPLLACAINLFDAENLTQPVRLLGFGVSNFTESHENRTERQPLLFKEMYHSTTAEVHNNHALDNAIDTLRERYGENVIRRGPDRNHNPQKHRT